MVVVAAVAAVAVAVADSVQARKTKVKAAVAAAAAAAACKASLALAAGAETLVTPPKTLGAESLRHQFVTRSLSARTESSVRRRPGEADTDSTCLPCPRCGALRR